MIKDNRIRKKLKKLLPKNYRDIVAKRVGCHPNTVYNVLNNEHDNAIVELEILLLAQEQKNKQEENDNRMREITDQL